MSPLPISTIRLSCPGGVVRFSAGRFGTTDIALVRGSTAPCGSRAESLSIRRGTSSSSQPDNTPKYSGA